MESNRTTIIGIGLMVLIFLVWFFANQPEPPKHSPHAAKQTAAVVDTAASDSTAQAAAGQAAAAQASAGHDTTSAQSGQSALAAVGDSARSMQALIGGDTSVSSTFRAVTVAQGPAVTKVIETPLFRATITSKGAMISSFVLAKYKTYKQGPLDLVNQRDYHGAGVALKFVGADGKVASTAAFQFTLDSTPVTLKGSETVSVSAVCKLDDHRSIVKTYTFSGDKYEMGVQFHLIGLQNSVSGYHYSAALDNPIPFVEMRSADELSDAKVFAGIAGDVEDLTAKKIGEVAHKPVNGTISFIGARNQYFTEALIPINEKTLGADLSARALKAPDGGVMTDYASNVHIPIQHAQNEDLTFKLYLGPLEYERVKAIGVGLEGVMYFGWSFIVRPISIYLLMPLFVWLHGFFANWGIVVIVFSILIKLATMPLSTGQMRSMRKMQVLAPKLTELRAKHKDDSKKMNEETMKLYRTYGVNPAGGCLPMVLQMPILFALYSVLRNTIQLRQADFAFWIHDLSIPDTLFHFGFQLPLLGDQISGLTLLLVVTMFIQQIFTVTDPRQKSMAYVMPIIFVFMFNNLPSGVGLYYFMFNILGLAQQLYMVKIVTPPTLEEMKADPKKSKGGFMARLQDMEEQQRKNRQQQYLGKTPGKGKKR